MSFKLIGLDEYSDKGIIITTSSYCRSNSVPIESESEFYGQVAQVLIDLEEKKERLLKFAGFVQEFGFDAVKQAVVKYNELQYLSETEEKIIHKAKTLGFLE